MDAETIVAAVNHGFAACKNGETLEAALKGYVPLKETMSNQVLLLFGKESHAALMELMRQVGRDEMGTIRLALAMLDYLADVQKSGSEIFVKTGNDVTTFPPLKEL